MPMWMPTSRWPFPQRGNDYPYSKPADERWTPQARIMAQKTISLSRPEKDGQEIVSNQLDSFVIEPCIPDMVRHLSLRQAGFVG